MPTGGSINALRPSNFALPLLRGGSLELNVEKLTSSSSVGITTATPSISRLFFSPSVTSGLPTTVISRLPTGSDSLYLFFDYDNMTPETVYELRVTLNGNINPIFSLAPVRWSGGTRGLWHIGNSSQVWPDGIYEFTVFINGISGSSPVTIVVGGPPDNTPAFRNITFGLMENNQMFGFGYLLATGQTVNAQFLYDNMQDGLPWAAQWYYDGRQIENARTETSWSSDTSNGTTTTALQIETGLPEGSYRLELYISGQLAALADFIIAGTRVDAFPRIFSEQRFVVAASPQAAFNANSITSFSDRVDTLYALFDWERIATGSLWQIRMSVDDVVFYDEIAPWSGMSSGQDFLVRLSGTQGVPDGRYRLELLINRVPLVSLEVEVGIGQLPIDLFTQPEGVLLRGQVLDAQTNLGVANITFILLGKEYSVEDYISRQDQVFAMATTDRNGRFQVNRPLQYDVPYSVILTAEGYLPLTADGFQVTNLTPNPFDMTIYLTSD